MLPGHRRRGIGRALYDAASARRRAAGRTSARGELTVVDDDGPLAFARAMGAVPVHEQVHPVLDLPLADRCVRELTSRAGDGYEIVTWQRRCPDDLIEAYAEMRTQMNQGRAPGRARARGRGDDPGAHPGRGGACREVLRPPGRGGSPRGRRDGRLLPGLPSPRG
ncbi:hypothetical protein LP418_20900 [Nocardioides sp. B-3]|nr:hypothetical protein [Nocardioides sp. B-3]UUZ58591.1 hypothetical protein LP418_20900 [Nocardioides sp. B-3]